MQERIARLGQDKAAGKPINGDLEGLLRDLLGKITKDESTDFPMPST